MTLDFHQQTAVALHGARVAEEQMWQANLAGDLATAALHELNAECLYEQAEAARANRLNKQDPYNHPRSADFIGPFRPRRKRVH